MSIRRGISLLFALVLMAAPVSRGEAALYCRTAERAVAECCCKPVDAPCASDDAMPACGCCEVRFAEGESAEGAGPLVPRTSLDPPERMAFGILTSVSRPGPALRFDLPLAGAPARPSPLKAPLYLLHGVFLC